MPIRGILRRSPDMWCDYSVRFLGYDLRIVPVTWGFLK